MVRKTYTQIKEEGRWRIRINNEIKDILQWAYIVKCITLRFVIPVVCVTNEREESVVNQHN